MLERALDYVDDFGFPELAVRRPGMIGRALSAMALHRARTAATTVIVAAAVVIVANAAFFQTADHPSPFFSTRDAVDDFAVPGAGAPLEAAAPQANEPAAPAVDEIGRLVEVAAVGARGFEGTAASVDVVRVQSLLSTLGYDPGTVDGLFGARTRAAIEAFQLDQGIAATGEITDALLLQLEITATETAGPAVVFPTDEARLLAIQTALNRSGYGPVIVDGQMTEETAVAIRSFQLAYGLTMTGVVDQQLIERMVELGALEL